MNNKKISIGDELYLVLNHGYGPFHKIDRHSKYKCFVTKIGKLYFTVSYGDQMKSTKEFNLKTFYEKSACTQHSTLYSSKEEYEDIIKTTFIKMKIRGSIVPLVNKMSHEDLETINNIIEKYDHE